MQSHHFVGRIAEMDHLLVNALNVCASGWGRPFIASGANLLFRKSSFEKYDRFNLHKHIPSGDDVYLLRDFRDAKAKVSLNSSKKLAVTAALPKTFKEFFEQRIRWAAKTVDVNDRLANGIVLLQTTLTFFFVLLFGTLIVQKEWQWVLCFWFTKSLMDVLFFLPYAYRSQRTATLLWIPLYELIYPIFALAIALASMLTRPTWKGRTVRVR